MKKSKRFYIIFGLIAVVSSTLVGGILGGLGEFLNIIQTTNFMEEEAENIPEYGGGWIGAASGFLVGIIYYLQLIYFRIKITRKLGFVALETFLGIIAGIIASCSVHIPTGLYYQNDTEAIIFNSLFFGSIAGLLVGLILSGIFASMTREKKINE